MDARRSTIPLAIWGVWLAFVLLLQFGPPALPQSLTRAWIDAAGRTLSIVSSSSESISSAAYSATESEQTQRAARATTRRLEAENRELARIVAELKQKVTRLQQALPVTTESDSSLMRMQAIPARVLGRSGTPLSRNLELLVALGRRDGLIGNDLVFTSEGVIVDQGHASGLDEDQLLTSDMSLYGRTAHVGRWTTLVQPLTAAEFQIGVQIVRRSTLGPVLGPRGILKGTGSGCRVDEVPATEAVAVGDEVFTDALVSPAGVRLYCGRVSQAEVGDDGHWTIKIAPLNRHDVVPTSVEVLQAELNPERLRELSSAPAVDLR